MPHDPLPSRVTTLSWHGVAWALLVIGFALLASACIHPDMQNPVWLSLATNVGGVMVATGGISILWELYAKRAFLSEVFSIARLSEEMRISGLCRATTKFQHDIEWPRLLSSVRELDVFFAYARTWINNNLTSLEAYARKSTSRMRLVLPDPNNQKLVAELARKFNTTEENMRERINESESNFINLFDKSRGAKGQLSIWHTDRTPVLAFYRLDSTYIMTAYSHRDGRVDIPTFMCDRAGTFTDFIQAEFDYLIDEARQGVRKVYPSKKS